jgi:vitamin-K-epoxide reductase (warfarin-sensitive)
MKLYIQVLCAAGMLISAYAFYVRDKVIKTTSYKPICDISARISCSRALGSRYSKTLGIPNPLAGFIFYVLLLALSFSEIHLIPYPAGISVLFSLYLAYISYIKQKNFCLVCTLTYLLNIALLVLSIMARGGG